MFRKLLLPLLLLLTPAIAAAQQTIVTATIKDPNGVPYAFGTGSGTLVCPGNEQPTVRGAPVPRTITITGLDGNGTFTQTFYDVNGIDQLGCAYRFAITDKSTAISFTTGLLNSVTGPSVNLSAAISAFSVPLPSQGGGSGAFGYTTVASSPTPLFNATTNTGYAFTLTSNAVATFGTPNPGTIYQFNICENATGGFTFTFPGNVVLPSGFAFNTAPNKCNQSAFIYDGTNWQPWNATGSVTPGGNQGDLQLKNTGILGPSQLNELSGVLNINDTQNNVNGEARFKGPDPSLDITAYGAVAIGQGSVPAAPGITATCTSGSPNVTLSSASTFQNGNGVALYGCGPTTVNTPAAPTVTPVVAATQTGTLAAVAAPAGSTTYCYQLVSRTFMGGIAPSTETCTTTGPASLGQQNISLASVSLTNNQATYTTSSPHGLVAGALVVITGVTTAEVLGLNANGNNFNGWFQVASTADNTHFVVNLTVDTRNGAVNAGTGGSVNYWNAIQIKATETTNNYEYYIYGRVTGGTKSLIGVMLPQDHQVIAGSFPDQFYLTWDDFGSPVSTFPNPPFYIPTTVPVASTNDMLATTIVSGAGTTSLVLAANAGNNNSGQTILLDDAVPFLNTVIASKAIGGFVRIPTSGTVQFVFNSPITMPAGAGIVTISQDGTVWMNEPIKFQQVVKWKQGTPSTQSAGSPGFSQQVSTNIFCAKASPCFLALTDFFMDGISWTQQSPNGSLAYLQDNGGIPAAGKFENVTWAGYTGGISYSNSSAIWRGGGAGFKFIHTAVLSSQNSSLVANTPGLWFNQASNLVFDGLSLSGAGVAVGPSNQGAGDFFDIKDLYCQGCYMPKFSITNAAGPVWMNINVDITDTNFGPANFTVANYAGSPLFLNGFLEQGVTGTGQGASGSAIGFQRVLSNLDVSNANTASIRVPGTTGSNTRTIDAYSVNDGTFGRIFVATDINNRSMGFGSGYSLFTLVPSYAAPICTATAGGSLNSGTYEVFYAPIFVGNGSVGTPSLSCTVTLSPGNQTITASVPATISGTSTLYEWSALLIGGSSAICGNFASPLVVASDGSGQACGSSGLGGGPHNAAGGPAGIHASTVWGQSFINGLTTLTSNATVARSVALPDLAGTLALTNAAQTFTSANTFTAVQTFSAKAAFNGALSTTFTDYPTSASPGNPSAGNIRVYGDSGSGNLTCLTSAGANCNPAGGGGGTPGGSSGQVQINSAGSFAGSVNLTYSSPALSIGSAAGATGQIKYVGTTSGTVTTQSQDAAGTWTFKWPTSAGTNNCPLVTDGTGVASWTCLTVAGGGTGGTTFGANQLISGNGTSAFQSVAGSTSGTNPVLKLQPSGASSVALVLDTQPTPTGDILQINVNTVKTTWVDAAGVLHVPQTTYTGSGVPLTLSGSLVGACASPLSGTAIICLGDLTTGMALLSNNGANMKPIVQSFNSNPVAHGLALWGITAPQLSSIATGVAGNVYVGGGASADGSMTSINLASAAAVGASILGTANGGTGSASLAAANIVTSSGAITVGHQAVFQTSTVIIDGGAPGGGGSPARLDQITGATGTASPSHGGNAIQWLWLLTGSTTAFKFGESGPSTGSNNIILQATTANTSSAIPFQADNNGNGVRLSSTGAFAVLGTGTITATNASPAGTNGDVMTWGSSGAFADSGVLGTNLVSASSNFTNGGLVKAAGANKTLTSADLTGDVTTSGSTAATIAALAVNSSKSTVELTRRVCDITVGDASASSAITNAQLGPQVHPCRVGAAGTVVEIAIESDAGSPNVIVGRRRCTTFTTGTCSAETAVNFLSSALASSSGFSKCSNTGGTTGLDGGTTCSATLQNTSLNVGDWIELVSGTAGGTAKLATIHVTYVTVN